MENAANTPKKMSRPSAVVELSILDGENSVFSGKDSYVIPIYQRPFAWEDDQLRQLVDDIDGFNPGEDAMYYLGSFVVHQRKDGRYEVIDGQQRLTAIYMLLHCAAPDSLPPASTVLSYDCREKSNTTLSRLSDIEKLRDVAEQLDEADIDTVIAARYLELRDHIKKTDERSQESTFVEKLPHVRLYRVEVPPHTDLNRYFEIMNSRGEQLELHDVLKARLMGELSSPNERSAFASIWDACADMSGYVQMHFHRIDQRRSLFGANWEECPTEERIRDTIWGNDSIDESSYSLRHVVESLGNSTDAFPSEQAGAEQRFESIIDFPHFLLHTLKVFVNADEVRDADDRPPLDDRKLLDAFEKAMNARDAANHVKLTRENFARGFIACLLKCRYLFDKCIIKREYAGASSEGVWSLKCLKKQSDKNGAYYTDSKLMRHDKSGGARTKRILMLQSCLRVSYTSPRVMHWITDLLLWLYATDGTQIVPGYEEQVEQIPHAAIRSFIEKGDYSKGADTPHIVFNYLDYLLWKRGETTREPQGDFAFEFRTSVEHWYAQNPSEETFDHWDDVDYFGNLCIMHRNANSKLSNWDPDAKASTFASIISKGSLKLRIMRDLIVQPGVGKEGWRDSVCRQHGEEMLDLLRKACSPQEQSS